MISFEADFNGDGCIGGEPAAQRTTRPTRSGSRTATSLPPEASPGRLYIIPQLVTAPTSDCESLGVPILAGRVDRFQIQYRSNEYRFDTSPTDGVTTWRELDSAPTPIGNANGVLDVELDWVNSLVVDLTLDAGSGRTYRTHLAMRNKT